MDENLRLFAIFFIKMLPSDSGISNRSSVKVSSRKFVCQLSEKIVIASGKGYTKTQSHRLVALTSGPSPAKAGEKEDPGAVRSVLRRHLVSYNYITSSLEAKVIPSIAKNARYRLTGSIVNNSKPIGKQRNSYCCFRQKMQARAQEKQTSVYRETLFLGRKEELAFAGKARFRYGASAILESTLTLNRSVLAGTEDNHNQLSAQRRFSTSCLSTLAYAGSGRRAKRIIEPVKDPYFKNIDELIEQIRNGVWPKYRFATNIERELTVLQKRYLHALSY